MPRTHSEVSRTDLSYLQEHQFQWRVTDKGGNVENVDRTKWQEPGRPLAGRGRLRVVSALALGRIRAGAKVWVTGELKWGKLGSGTNIPCPSGMLTERELELPHLKNTLAYGPLSASVGCFSSVLCLVGSFHLLISLSWVISSPTRSPGTQSTHRSCQAYTRVTLSNSRDPG